MRLRKLRKPDLNSVFNKVAMPLMHIMYGGIVLSFLVPVGYDLFKGNELKPFQLSAGIWSAQTYFYYFQHHSARMKNIKQGALLAKVQSTLDTTHKINEFLLERISKLPSSALKEVGLSIRKREKVRADTV